MKIYVFLIGQGRDWCNIEQDTSITHCAGHPTRLAVRRGRRSFMRRYGFWISRTPFVSVDTRY